MSSTPLDLDSIADAVASGEGTDGHYYVVRPLSWTMEKIEKYWELCEPHHIFSSELPAGPAGMFQLVTRSGALWFEIYDQTLDEVVGLMYLSDFIPNFANTFVIQANWHGLVWDAKASPRMDVAKQAIANLMRMLKIHRLQAELPTSRGGALRVAKRLGFVEEGVMRKARMGDIGWSDIALLSILDEEVG